MTRTHLPRAPHGRPRPPRQTLHTEAPLHRVATGITSTHFFCGVGGDTLGLAEAGITPVVALNHSPVAVATHTLNFPGCAHDAADINNYDMRRLPRTNILFGSPICKEASPASGLAAPKKQLTLDDAAADYAPAASWERTRATAYDLLRAAEVHRYDAVMWENVVRFGTRWELFDWWLGAWEVLGYVPQVVSVNAAHVGGDSGSTNARARQDRNRLIGVMTRKGIKPPDLRVRPECVCAECGPVRGIQKWRNPRGRRLGAYGEQYDYVCPNRRCGHLIVAPVTDAVEGIIDWDLPLRRIADGKPKRKEFTPYPDTTRARIQGGLDLYRRVAEDGRRARGVIVHLGRDTAPRLTSSPLTTVACKPHHALVIPGDSVDGSLMRMLGPRETAQAQRLPVTYQLHGTEAEKRTQIGNAVPVNLAHWAAKRLMASLV
ncbi:DNA cytosine methyltransferase [Streptomyces sp. NPDC059718]